MLGGRVIALLLLVSSLAFGQALTAVPTTFNSASNPAAMQVTVCTTNPGRGTCGSLAIIYTDKSLTTACSGTGTALNNTANPTNDSGCSNPGFSDANGNVLAFAAAGAYWCQIAYSPPSSVPCPSGGSSSGSGIAPVFASYTFNTNGTTVNAVNNTTGATSFTGTDASAVINSALAATVGAGVDFYGFFKRGIYPLNSMTLEGATNCPYYYAIGIPSNALGSFVHVTFEGEGPPMWLGEYGTAAIAANGVIFNLTSTALTMAGTNYATAIWQRPTGTPAAGCAITFTNSSNDLEFIKIGVRVPASAVGRGNIGGITAWAGNSVIYKGVSVDPNVQYPTLATGSAPVAGTVGSFGLTSTASGLSVPQRFDDSFVTGFDVAYDWISEHINSSDSVAIYNNYPAKIGRGGTQSPTVVFHPDVITNFHDQENAKGFALGTNMASGSHLTITGLDVELGVANWYARSALNLTEANAGNTSCDGSYMAITQNTGIVAEVPAQFIFSTGGLNCRLFEGTSSPIFALVGNVSSPITDTFTRPTNSGTGFGSNGLGTPWVNGAQASNQNLAIVSNSAQINRNTSGTGWSAYIGQTFNSAQSAKATVASIDNNSATFFEVLTNESTSPTVRTYYSYYCSNAAAGGSGLIKEVAGTPTTLISQASSSGCAAPDTLELQSIPNVGGTCVTLWAYHNSVLDTNFSNPYTDCSSPLSGGAPGLFLAQDAANVISATNWVGTSLPTLHGTDALAQYPVVAPEHDTFAAFGSFAKTLSAACETSYGISTLTATYTTGLNCLPANSIIDSVVYRITTAITGTTTSFQVGDGTTVARFCAAQSTLTLGTTGICFAQNWSATLAASGVQAAAAKIVVTSNGTITAGAIRLIVYYHTWAAPTS